MPIGVKTNSPTYYVKMLGTKKEDKDKPVIFAFSMKNQQTGDYEIREQSQDFEGTFTDLNVEEFEFEGKKKKVIKVVLHDGNFRYVLSLGFSMLGRSAINSLASIKEMGGILTLTCYRNSKTGYPSLFLEYNGQRLEWKYSIDQLPKPKEVEFNGDVMKDYTAMNKLFEDEAKKIQALIKEQGVTEPLPEGDIKKTPQQIYADMHGDPNMPEGGEDVADGSMPWDEEDPFNEG